MTETHTPEHAGFAEALTRGHIAFPWCESCRRFHWYPKPVCPHCRAERPAWRTVSGPGTVYSFTVVQHAFDETRRDALPYIVALVTFADAPGVRLVTNLIDVAPADAHIGMAVEPVLPVPNEAQNRVLFRPTRDATIG